MATKSVESRSKGNPKSFQSYTLSGFCIYWIKINSMRSKKKKKGWKNSFKKRKFLICHPGKKIIFINIAKSHLVLSFSFCQKRSSFCSSASRMTSTTTTTTTTSGNEVGWALPPHDGAVVHTIEMHTVGEPTRIVKYDFPELGIILRGNV